MKSATPIGIAILVFKNGRILFARGAKEWHVPQGLLNAKDRTFEEAAKRVIRDCGNLSITEPAFLCYKSWGRERPINGAKHSLYFTAIWTGGKGKNWHIGDKEYNQWDWFDFNLLPHPLFVAKHIFDKDTLRKIRRIARQSK